MHVVPASRLVVYHQNSESKPGVCWFCDLGGRIDEMCEITVFTTLGQLVLRGYWRVSIETDTVGKGSSHSFQRPAPFRDKSNK